MAKKKTEKTPKQLYASKRNWAKAQVINRRVTLSPVTVAEARILKDIDNLYKELLEHWDRRTETLMENYGNGNS